MSPAYLRQLIAIADNAEAAGHGQKEAVYRTACTELGVSRATLLAQLKQVKVGKQRKRRADAGQVALELEEAKLISAYYTEGKRKNNKKTTSLNTTVEALRMNNIIYGSVIDHDTGEVLRPLSDSAIARGLRAYHLHPEQMAKPTPHTNLQSKHPNHVWQVDASVCVIYYLPDGSSEMVELDKAVHYKNKPDNLNAIEQFRVIRYVLVDHYSGVLRYRYYPHAESGRHTVHFIAWAMAAKADDPFHGKPECIMVDPGATSGGLVQRFCQTMTIQLIVNKAHNPRAKGAVEKGNDLVECSFEQTLRYLKVRPANFEVLNVMAQRYQLHWNLTKIHSRTKQTRFGLWLTISPTQLIKTPPIEVLLSLATDKPATPKVGGDLTIQFKTRFWDVSAVPNVVIGEKITVHWHPFINETAMAIVFDDNGYEQHIALRERVKNELSGFYEDAAMINEVFKARADTVVDSNRKAIQRLAAGTDTLKDTEKKRAHKHYVPLAHLGIDPQIASKAELPTFLPKRGTEIDLNIPQYQELKNNPIQIAQFLKARLGDDYAYTLVEEVNKAYPAGATNSELEAVLVHLANGKTAAGRPRLTAI